jgi:rRNA maturation RNase YbeY
MSVRLSGPPRRRDGPAPDRRLLARRARRVLAALGVPRSELSVALVDDATMAALNERWRGRGGPTDVLSFSLVGGAAEAFRHGLLGDVVISLDTAARQARRAHRRIDDECTRLLVHGVLHLLGHDHERADEARAMRAEERRLLRLVRP